MKYDYRIIKVGDDFIAQRRLKHDEKDCENLDHYWASIHQEIKFCNREYIEMTMCFNAGTSLCLKVVSEELIANYYSQSLTDAVNRVKIFREENEPWYSFWEPNIFLRLFKKDIIPVIDEEGKIFNVRAKKSEKAIYRLPRAKRKPSHI